MRVSEMNWMQVEAYLRHDDRCVVPLGSTEQHCYLSLSVDSILSERVAAEAAAPLGVPVFPVLAYGITPYFTAFPGTLTLRVETYLAVVRDLLDGLAHSGFRRILLCNGHGGNAPAAGLAVEWISHHPTAACASTTGGTRRARRRRRWRSTRSVRMRPGRRTSPGRGLAMSPRRRAASR